MALSTHRASPLDFHHQLAIHSDIDLGVDVESPLRTCLDLSIARTHGISEPRLALGIKSPR